LVYLIEVAAAMEAVAEIMPVVVVVVRNPLDLRPSGHWWWQVKAMQVPEAPGM
jgi:hypothetical protein